MDSPTQTESPRSLWLIVAIQIFVFSEALVGLAVDLNLVRAAQGSVLDALRHSVVPLASGCSVLDPALRTSVKLVSRWKVVAVRLAAVGIPLVFAVAALVIGEPTLAAVLAGNGLLFFICLRVLTTHSAVELIAERKP
jgi:hypothetical protein